MNHGLPPVAVAGIQQVLSRHPRVEQAVLYGSRAKGNYKPGSDIDLTLVGDLLTHADLLTLIDQLDELLLPYQIDLSVYQMIQQADLLDHIRRVGIVFYERKRSSVLPDGR